MQKFAHLERDRGPVCPESRRPLALPLAQVHAVANMGVSGRVGAEQQRTGDRLRHVFGLAVGAEHKLASLASRRAASLAVDASTTAAVLAGPVAGADATASYGAPGRGEPQHGARIRQIPRDASSDGDGNGDTPRVARDVANAHQRCHVLAVVVGGQTQRRRGDIVRAVTVEDAERVVIANLFRGLDPQVGERATAIHVPERPATATASPPMDAPKAAQQGSKWFLGGARSAAGRARQ